MLRVGIVGASGYTGSELIRFLIGHPEQVKIECITSRTLAEQKLADIQPNLRGFTDLVFEDLDIEKVSEKVDIAFLGLPHGAAMDYAPGFIKNDVKVIDFSADYRIREVGTYEEYYQKHVSSHLIPMAVYGLPEMYREDIKDAKLVANPGCYPTGAILAILPALKAGLVGSDEIIIDSKSGISGAGKTPKEVTHLPNRLGNFTAYNIASHRHQPEIEQEIAVASGQDIKVCFVPHLVPMTRGILTTAYVKLSRDISDSELLGIYMDYYKDEPFVRVLEGKEIPQTQAVRGSNFCDIGMKVVSKNNMAIFISAIDNLTKGASGQALQNMNIIAGFDETAGLQIAGLMP
ncbi:N-acetyl-gamma-glutamyl-phosphate reductase [Candidatus Poribacteria bacterium]|nr:N-acetyl-gamma-glutamyl-phosphate reductase [Candidatus Poribacteria bacterium]